MIGVLAVVGLHSMVEFPLWHANFLGMFALLFGAASPGGASVAPTRLRRGLVLVVVLAGASPRAESGPTTVPSSAGIWPSRRSLPAAGLPAAAIWTIS